MFPGVYPHPPQGQDSAMKLLPAAGCFVTSAHEKHTHARRREPPAGRRNRTRSAPLPGLADRPRRWKLPIRDVLVYRSAGLLVPVTGAIKLMPGTGSDPAFRRADVETGAVTGLF